MRDLTRRVAIVLFAALVLVPAVYAQDPAKVGPDIYKCTFENERIRLCEVKFKPGASIGVHSHPPHLVYVSAPGKLKITPKNGDPVEVDFTAGQTVWSPPDAHSAVNVGKSELRGLVIELKEMPDPVQSALTKIENDWAQALMKADVAAMEPHIGSDWILVGPDGARMNWPEMKASLTSGDLKFTSTVLSDLEVRVMGDTAIVSGRSSDKGMFKGQDISGDYRFTDVFVKRDGKWVAVSTHVTRISS